MATKKASKRITPSKNRAPADAATKPRAASKRNAAKAAQKPAPKASSVKPPQARADFGAPIDGFFAKQPPALRAILLTLRKLIEATVPRTSDSTHA